MNEHTKQQARAIAKFWMMTEQEYVEKLIDREYRSLNQRAKRAADPVVSARWTHYRDSGQESHVRG